MRMRKVIALGAVAFVGLLGVREAGAFDLNLNSSNSEVSYESECSTDTKDPVWNSWSTRVQFDEAEPCPSPGVVQAAENTRTAEIVIHVDPYEVEGCTWLPLYKWGSCSFSAQAIRNGSEWATMKGTIAMNVKGLASSRFVRESLREEIRARVTKTVDSWMRP